MLDGLLGRGFSSKCKSSIKLIKARIDVIRRKRNAMQKFLKKDIADLLKNGLELNAYGRAEGLLVELSLSFCYDSVEQFCGSIPRHLSVMQKQRECPEECREAVSTLMFAAARFADLPELRDLRQIFTERYGNSLESFVHQEFVENIALGPPTMDKKLQLLREIAKEFSVKWDSKAFEQKLTKAPTFELDQPKRPGSIHNPSSDGNKQQNNWDDTALKRDTRDVLTRGRRALTDDGFKAQDREETVRKRDNQDIRYGGGQELTVDSYKPHNGRVEPIRKRDTLDVSSHGRRALIDDGYKAHNGRDELVRKGYNQDMSFHGRREVIDDGFIPRSVEEETKRDHQYLFSHGRQELGDNSSKSRYDRDTVLKRDDNLTDSFHGRKKHDDGYQLHKAGRDSAHKRDNLNISSNGRHEYASHHATKQKPNHVVLTEKVAEEEHSMKPHKNMIPPPYVKPNGGRSDRNKAPTDPPIHNKDIPNDISERTQTRSDRVEYEKTLVGPTRLNGHGDENDHHHQDDLVGNLKSKPRSTRRRHKKLYPGHDYIDNTEVREIVKRNPSSRKREDARRGLQQVLDDDCDVRDKEERMMDRLLLHYSKKPSNLEPGKVLGAGQDASPLHHHDVANGSETQRRRSRALPPTRAMSLPPEPVTPTTEAGRVPTRATSFKHEMLSPVGHVHPKLPDYDDLADRLASLRRR